VVSDAAPSAGVARGDAPRGSAYFGRGADNAEDAVSGDGGRGYVDGSFGSGVGRAISRWAGDRNFDKPRAGVGDLGCLGV
jgi:hypothetical protein